MAAPATRIVKLSAAGSSRTSIQVTCQRLLEQLPGVIRLARHQECQPERCDREALAGPVARALVQRPGCFEIGPRRRTSMRCRPNLDPALRIRDGHLGQR
jgi:hypothetical protein